MVERAILGGGCFWCLDAVYRRVRGVSGVVSGYAGGGPANPSYEQVCTGRTGHAEVVQVDFDPAAIGYDDILRIFFAIHDPTTLNRQGHDVGTQYRSIIFTLDDAQAQTARRVLAEIEAAAIWGAPLVTAIEPLVVFYPAEDYHQDYFTKNPGAGYCMAVVAPKVAKFRKQFADRLV